MARRCWARVMYQPVAAAGSFRTLSGEVGARVESADVHVVHAARELVIGAELAGLAGAAAFFFPDEGASEHVGGGGGEFGEIGGDAGSDLI